MLVVTISVNTNNEYLERLTRTGPKRLHVLYKYILSKFNAYNMNAHAHARTHTDSQEEQEQEQKKKKKKEGTDQQKTRIQGYLFANNNRMYRNLSW